MAAVGVQSGSLGESGENAINPEDLTQAGNHDFVWCQSTVMELLLVRRRAPERKQRKQGCTLFPKQGLMRNDQGKPTFLL
jgi:hypothetical protein